MKKPYEIHSDFFKKMIASGWDENREIILDSLPHHGRTQPARQTGVLLRIRPLRYRRQSAQKQQLPR